MSSMEKFLDLERLGALVAEMTPDRDFRVLPNHVAAKALANAADELLRLARVGKAAIAYHQASALDADRWFAAMKEYDEAINAATKETP